FDRRAVMLACDAVAGVCVLGVALLIAAGHLALWHVAIVAATVSTCLAIQVPAYLASMTQLVPPRHLGRANGLVQPAPAVSQVAAPPLAGVLVATVGIDRVMFVDAATYVVSIATLLAVRIAPPPLTDRSTAPSLWRDALCGWTYQRDRPFLRLLLGYSALVSFALSMSQ